MVDEITIATNTLSAENARPPPAAAHAMCSLCARAPAYRRTLCWACYKKLRYAHIKLPPSLRTGRPRGLVPLLVAIVVALTPDERAILRRALDAAA